MSLASNNLLKTIYSGQNPNEKSKRMAKVISNSSAGYKVQFYGEEVSSEKSYKKYSHVYISNGNTVVLEKINGTYIITGRV